MRSLQLALFIFAAALTAIVGCSVKVDVSDQNTDEKSRTAVEVGLFAGNQSELPPAPPATPEKSETFQPAHEPAPPPPTFEPPSRGSEDSVPVKPARNSIVVVKNVVNVYDFDVQRHHETHYHYELPQRSRESVKVRIEVVRKSERDERCEKLLREHLERVAEWGAMFK